MDWLFANWALAAGLGRQPRRRWHNYDDDFRTPGTLIGVRSRLSTVEMWLVRLTYKEIAAELRCEKCGAPLGRELRFIPPGDHDPVSWRLLAVTRCSGWRRHRHAAGVAESSKDLVARPVAPDLTGR